MDLRVVVNTPCTLVCQRSNEADTCAVECIGLPALRALSLPTPIGEGDDIATRLQLLSKSWLCDGLEELTLSCAVESRWLSVTNDIGTALAGLRKLKKLQLRVEYSNLSSSTYDPKRDTTILTPWHLSALTTLNIHVAIDVNVDLGLRHNPTIITIVAPLLGPDASRPFVLIVPEM